MVKVEVVEKVDPQHPLQPLFNQLLKPQMYEQWETT
jgi:hypothetical protein